MIFSPFFHAQHLIMSEYFSKCIENFQDTVMDDAARKAREEYLKKYLGKDKKQSRKKHNKKKMTRTGFVVVYFQIGALRVRR